MIPSYSRRVALDNLREALGGIRSEYVANMLLDTRAAWAAPAPASVPAPRFTVPAAQVALRACPLCAIRHAGNRCTR